MTTQNDVSPGSSLIRQTVIVLMDKTVEYTTNQCSLLCRSTKPVRITDILFKYTVSVVDVMTLVDRKLFCTGIKLCSPSYEKITD